jgi:CRISPR-associated endonuclease/helicase Cas3
LFADGNIDINEYYRLYFDKRRNTMDYCVKDGSIYDLLTANHQGCTGYKDRGNKNEIGLYSAIRSASDAFFVIDRGQTSVIVPYAESGALLNQYMDVEDITEKNQLLRKLGRYSVSLYEYQIQALHRALDEKDGLTVLDGGDRKEGFYSDEFGVNVDGKLGFLDV